MPISISVSRTWLESPIDSPSLRNKRYNRLIFEPVSIGIPIEPHLNKYLNKKFSISLTQYVPSRFARLSYMVLFRSS